MMAERKNWYTSVKIPKPLSEQIKHIMYGFGYTSVSDFVLDATRTQMRELGYLWTKQEVKQ